MSFTVERYVGANGARLWTARDGSGPPLLLLHGGPGLWESFDELGAMIGDLAEVHRFDQRGGGRSSRTTPFTVATLLHARLAIIPGAGHWPWLENPEPAREAIRAFLAAIGADR
jgi:pimeloyl-ACP methyl ester carboxylesterase